MRNTLKLILALLLFGIGFTAFAFFRAQQSLTTKSDADFLDKVGIALSKNIFYPQEKTITNSAGKSIAINLVGRGEKTIYFLKNDNDKVYDYSIESLSDEDQKQVTSLPLTAFTKSESSRKSSIKRSPIGGLGSLNQRRSVGSDPNKKEATSSKLGEGRQIE